MEINENLMSFYTMKSDVPGGPEIREKIVSKYKVQEAIREKLNTGMAEAMKKTEKINLTDYKLDQLVADLKKANKDGGFATPKGSQLIQVAHIAVDMLSKEKNQLYGNYVIMPKHRGNEDKQKGVLADIKRLEGYIAQISELAQIKEYKGNSGPIHKGWF